MNYVACEAANILQLGEVRFRTWLLQHDICNLLLMHCSCELTEVNWLQCISAAIAMGALIKSSSISESQSSTPYAEASWINDHAVIYSAHTRYAPTHVVILSNPNQKLLHLAIFLQMFTLCTNA